jgi:hypothetical protein
MIAMDEPRADGARHHAPDTVTDALDILRGLGYVDEFELEDDQLRSTSGDIVCVVTEALVEHLYRFEGPSDPGDEMVVFGLHDPTTGARGTLATAFGPAADPGLGRHLADLSQRFG